MCTRRSRTSTSIRWQPSTSSSFLGRKPQSNRVDGPAFIRSTHRCSRAHRAMKLTRDYVRKLYNQFQATLVPSELLAELLSEWGVRNVRVVPLGVNVEIFHPSAKGTAGTRISLGIASDQRFLLSVGRLAKEKNTKMLFEAFELLQRRQPGEYHLVVIGDGPQRNQLRQLQNRTDGAVSWIRYCADSADLARFYRAADLFIPPRIPDRFGLAAWAT